MIQKIDRDKLKRIALGLNNRLCLNLFDSQLDELVSHMALEYNLAAPNTSGVPNESPD